MVAVELHNLGHVEIRRGNGDAAARYFAELELLRTSNDPYSTAMAQLNQSAVAWVAGDQRGARTLVAAAEATLSDHGMVAARDDQAEIDWLRRNLATVPDV